MKDIYWLIIFLTSYWLVTYVYRKVINIQDYDRKSTLKAYLIWLFGGIFGLHNYYLNFKKKNKIYALSMLIFLSCTYFFSWKEDISLFKVFENFDSNAILSSILSIIVFQYVLDLVFMRFWVFKSNYSERKSSVLDFSEQLKELRKDVKKINNRIAKDLNQDFV